MRVKLGLLSAITFGFLALPFISERFIVSLFAQSVPTPIYILLCGIFIVYTLNELRTMKGYTKWTIGITLYVILWIIISGLPKKQIKISSESGSDSTISIAVWNTQYWDQGKNQQQLSEVIKALDADVLLIQEHIYWSQTLKQKLPANNVSILERCCGYSQILKKDELVIASRFPISNVLIDAPYIQKVTLAKLYSAQRQLSIVNTHVPVQYDITSPPWEQSFWTHMFKALDIRHSTFDSLSKFTNEQIFIAGDFNSTVLSPAIRGLSSRLTSITFRPSFPNGKWIPPLWTIDHIFHSKDITADCRLITSSSINIPIPSDHLPVRCVITL